jgi:hypothetical protein
MARGNPWPSELLYLYGYSQRESTASIKAAPKAYEQGEPAKQQSIIEFDCRGLEFTDFHPEVKTHDLRS